MIWECHFIELDEDIILTMTVLTLILIKKSFRLEPQKLSIDKKIR